MVHHHHTLFIRYIHSCLISDGVFVVENRRGAVCAKGTLVMAEEVGSVADVADNDASSVRFRRISPKRANCVEGQSPTNTRPCRPC